MSYDVLVDSYRSRVRELLDKNNDAYLLYAALELRCGVETRMKEFLEPLHHIPKSQRREYAIGKLGKSISTAFQITDQLALFTIVFPETNDEITLRYVPIPKRLQEIASKLGDVLHYIGERNAEDPNWWQRLRSLLEEGYEWFAYVASGDLIGVPLLNTKNRTTHLRMFLWADDPRSQIAGRLTQGAKHIIRVAYEPIPKVPPNSNSDA